MHNVTSCFSIEGQGDDLIPESPHAIRDLLDKRAEVTYYGVSESMACTQVLRGKLVGLSMRKRTTFGPFFPVVHILPKRKRKPVAVMLRDSSLLVEGTPPVRIDSEGTDGMSGFLLSGNACLNFVESPDATPAVIRALVATNVNPGFNAHDRVRLLRRRMVGNHCAGVEHIPLAAA